MDLRISTGRLRRLLRNTLHAEHTIERPHPEIQSTNEPGQNEDSDETALPFAIADAKPGGPNLQEKHHA